MIDVEHLSKSYGAHLAVDDVSFHVRKGEVVGFLGPNGAGKSTTLRILAGFLGATSGRVTVAGHDLVEAPMRARASLGYMPETSPLYPELRASEYLAFRAELKRVPRAARREAVARAMRDTGVEEVAGVIIGQLSKGYRQRVGLADALVGDPPLLILDEPTAGLDPNQIREVRALVRRLGSERTVLLSTHILSEVEATCSRALVIARGRLVAEGSIDEIRAMRRASGARVTVRGASEEALLAVGKVPGVARAALSGEGDGGTGEITLIEGPANAESRLTLIDLDLDAGADGGQVAEEVVRALVGAGLGVREIAPHVASLEQVFSELTADEPAGAPAPPRAAKGPAGRAKKARR